MAQAPRDQNFIPTVLFESSSSPGTVLSGKIDEITGRILVDNASATGTVTSVSVVSANGFAGSVATATTTPAITISTTITGIIKGNGTAISAAIAGTDYADVTFKTISVSGQSDVVADSAADTLTLAAGSNITITTNAGTDTITIAAAGSSGATTALDNLSAVAINAALVLGTSDAFALGSTTKQWSDLFLAEGGVINWDNGDVTLTQSGDTLTVAGGVLVVPTNGLTINATNVTSTGTQLNYLNAATGTTGTNTTNLVFSTSPTLTTPTLGVASATSINKVAITAPASSATLTIADGKTLTASNSITLAGTDGKGINVGAATSGKILIGDGTNMVLSTSTIPTSAGATANKVLLSDGTNYVLSTPTFPNASATSGKVIKSDGTNWAASTETYAAPGSSGNVMTSDGTNWTSAATAGGGAGKTFVPINFETLGRYATGNGSGTGAVTANSDGFSLTTGATTNSKVVAQYYPFASGVLGLLWDKSPKMSMCMTVGNPASGTGDSFFGIGKLDTFDSGSFNYATNHVGWKILKTAGVMSLYATVGDGTETASSALTTLANGDALELYFSMNANTSVDFYWAKNGAAMSSATNLASHVPGAGSTGAFLGWGAGCSSANAYTFTMCSARYER